MYMLWHIMYFFKRMKYVLLWKKFQDILSEKKQITRKQNDIIYMNFKLELKGYT